jgi:hypothetical protein
MAYDYDTGAEDVTAGADDATTAGAGDYATVGAAPGGGMILRRPGFAPMALRPGASIPWTRPGGGGGGGGGLSAAQVTALINKIIDQRVPYGDVPSKPRPDEAMFPMGMGSVTILPATALGEVVLTAKPQRAFRGERLVLSIFRSVGAVGIPVVISSFSVGDYKQLIGGGALPVDVFASDAFGVRLMLDASVPGVEFVIGVKALAVVPAGEQIIIAGAVIGRAGEAAAR